MQGAQFQNCADAGDLTNNVQIEEHQTQLSFTYQPMSITKSQHKLEKSQLKEATGHWKEPEAKKNGLQGVLIDLVLHDLLFEGSK